MSNATQQLKAQQRRQKFADLLREMFQLNQPELDFGLYRIMHARKDDINRFIEQDLPRITQEAFSQYASQDQAQLEAELEEHIKNAKGLGMDPDAIPKVQELKQKLQCGFDLAREEGEVYDALVTFFNRYYNEGDFLSRRVYKDGTYAIPYQGEEVVLHWANKDQYYIKSSETLRDYSFRLNPDAGPGEDPMRVHFKLVDAEAGAKDNNKESAESRRVFVLDVEDPFELIEGEETEHGEHYTDLQCRFMFRSATESDWTEAEKKKVTAAAQKKPPTQDALRAIAEQRLLGAASDLPEPWKSALAKPYRKADGNLADYSILAGQLNNYTKKNTFDYFIHKDLAGFLTRELDFYIKNELLDWEDIASLKNDTARLAPLLSKIEVIRLLGEKIIAFLAQLENFQKKLWLKKKFVTETNYCLTLDILADHDELLAEIFNNCDQLKEWEDLYKIDLTDLRECLEKEGHSGVLDNPKYRHLMIDTAKFDHLFKQSLICSIDGIDEKCDGVVVNAENFQGLCFLKERYESEVECIYIDPPYNTDASAIMYKNGYKSSSWMSLMNDRLQLARDLMCRDGVLASAIDDEQQKELAFLLESVFRSELLGVFSIRSNPSGRPTKTGYSVSHEYNLFVGRTDESNISRLPPTDAQLSRFSEKDESGIFEWRNLRREGSNSDRNARRALYYPIYIRNEKAYVPEMYWEDQDKSWVVTEDPKPTDSVVWPINDQGDEKTWRWENSKVASSPDLIGIRKDRSGKDYVYYKRRPNDDGVVSVSSWFDAKYSATEHGSALIKDLFGKMAFSYPKSIHAVKDTVHISGGSKKDAKVLDFFAGSGTTGHAVIDKNRIDGGNRKYLLIEMGEHFDTVIIPRLKKVSYSARWKAGLPQLSEDGTFESMSQFFKYLRLESYEDSLNNLSQTKSPNQQKIFGELSPPQAQAAREAYFLNYMLEVESRESNSLLNVRKFREPNHYELKVCASNSDQTRSINVDLLETFNYLLGLKVEHIAAPIHFEAELNQGDYGRWQAKVKRSETGKWWFRTVYGTNRAGQQVLVVWRNLPSVIDGEADGIQKDNAVLDAVLIEKLSIRLTESQDDEIDVLYVNGDHNISIPRSRKGEPMEQARIQLIEEAFHRLMFADTEAVH
ncbi:site-specific DNA-methyltransferase [Marinobacter salexigens]|uniref:site-specific DNA-methyltransferase n=1 Tax=Marinobacter salexigens TaxID=1925763 RepID=UPI000C2915F0|nr:site-specific DNA-methyltransferase [Marinobacter salexigens]